MKFDSCPKSTLCHLQPFRAHVPMDKTVAQQTWGALANAIDEIYNRNASQLSFEELYRNAYNLVLHKYGTLLYEGVTQKLTQHLTATAKRLEEVPDSSLLEEISTTWAEHQVRLPDLLRCEQWEFRDLLFLTNSSVLSDLISSAIPTDYHDYGPRYPHVHGPYLHHEGTTTPGLRARSSPFSP